VTAFGDPASSRVLVDGDPHIENIGTFRASDGTMIVDWNDFDGAGYGPYECDVRRLATALIVATMNDATASDLAREVGLGYAEQMADLEAGKQVAAITTGAHPYFDQLIAKAKKKGDARTTLDEVAPVQGGARAIAFGDVEPVDPDGVIAFRLEPVGVDDELWIDRVVETWRTRVAMPAGEILLETRKIGQGVSSYASLRYLVVLSGPSTGPEDDLLIELKEEGEGVLVRGVPELEASEWPTPATRVVDAQGRMQARRDSDILLGAGEATPLSLRIRDATDYQKGVNATDVQALAPDAQRSLARLVGRMLARAHGQASTEDGVPGWTVIAPLLGDGQAFADEVSQFAVGDAAQVVADWTSLHDRDLAQLVLPEVTP
jgi:uncharacterized protein (DUF2252 family)